MATNLSTCHPGDGIEALNRLPGLAEPLLQNRLRTRAAATAARRPLAAGNWAKLQNLAKYPDFRIVLILMKGGTRMRQHRAEGRAPFNS
jgi:hypothetical protein